MNRQEVERDSKRLGDDNCTVAKTIKNIEKNRWRNILPFDDNRITSEHDEDFYINASMIQVCAGPRSMRARTRPPPMGVRESFHPDGFPLLLTHI